MRLQVLLNMNQTVCPEVSRSLPGAGLQLWSVLNDEEGCGIEPDKRREASQYAEKWGSGLRLNFSIFLSYRRGPQSY